MTNSYFADFLVYRADRAYRALPAAGKAAARAEFAAVLFDAPGVTVRGCYSMVGLRHDADFTLWLVAESVDPLQDLAARLLRTRLGQYLETTQVFVGMARGASRYVADHLPAFVQGKPPRKYLSLYPFVKTADWYLLSFEERRRLMIQHGDLAEPHSTLTNTVSSFGINDGEFILAFETDDLPDFVAMVERLRAAEVRKYTLKDTPILLGIRKDVDAVLQDLG
ncbi:MAG: chlorite dismutase family protein [Armatimonadetes bacterium]|nr:chlorite dismutase family protein [Armatimonadota bacterium]